MGLESRSHSVARPRINLVHSYEVNPHLLLLPLKDRGRRWLRPGSPPELNITQEHDVVRRRLDVRQGDAALHYVLGRGHRRHRQRPDVGGREPDVVQHPLEVARVVCVRGLGTHHRLVRGLQLDVYFFLSFFIVVGFDVGLGVFGVCFGSYRLLGRK